MQGLQNNRPIRTEIGLINTDITLELLVVVLV